MHRFAPGPRFHNLHAIMDFSLQTTPCKALIPRILLKGLVSTSGVPVGAQDLPKTRVGPCPHSLGAISPTPAPTGIQMWFQKMTVNRTMGPICHAEFCGRAILKSRIVRKVWRLNWFVTRWEHNGMKQVAYCSTDLYLAHRGFV